MPPSAVLSSQTGPAFNLGDSGPSPCSWTCSHIAIHSPSLPLLKVSAFTIQHPCTVNMRITSFSFMILILIQLWIVHSMSCLVHIFFFLYSRRRRNNYFDDDVARLNKKWRYVCGKLWSQDSTSSEQISRITSSAFWRQQSGARIRNDAATASRTARYHLRLKSQTKAQLYKKIHRCDTQQVWTWGIATFRQATSLKIKKQKRLRFHKKKGNGEGMRKNPPLQPNWLTAVSTEWGT